MSSRIAPLGRGDLATSLVLIFPLFLAYEIGALFTSSVNGADFVTRAVFAATGGDRSLYLMVQLVLAALFVTAVVVLRRRRAIDLGRTPEVAMESAIYALTIGTLIIFVMQRLLGLMVGLERVDAAVESWAEGVVIGPTGEMLIAAVGAGVHEELVFRLGLFAGGAALLIRLGLRPLVAVALAAVVSSVAFSFAHHVGAYGEAFELHAFIYRLLAGAIFAAIFYFRSLAHAVYTHALYDVYVMVLS